MTANIDWVTGYQTRTDGPIAKTQSASYSLSGLAERSLLDRGEVSRMLLDTDLRDYAWHLVWGEDYATSDDELAARIGDVNGYVVFIHGWTGSRDIWEDMPARIVAQNRRLVALVVDHNGFGDTQFVQPYPEMDRCDPPAAMNAVERLLDLLKMRRQPGETKPKVINLVGHSMGGAALFFADESKWRYAEMTRTAIAPALLLHDESHRTFYTTLGLGIGLVGRIRALELIDHVVSPQVLEALTEGATDAVVEVHRRVYAATPKTVTARTFIAMGQIQRHPEPHHWDLMRVILAHRDRLVGLVPMMDLLQELTFDIDQIRVVAGTHYMFSVGTADFRRAHEQARRVVVDDIVSLHNQAMTLQRG